MSEAQYMFEKLGYMLNDKYKNHKNIPSIAYYKNVEEKIYVDDDNFKLKSMPYIVRIAFTLKPNIRYTKQVKYENSDWKYGETITLEEHYAICKQINEMVGIKE